MAFNRNIEPGIVQVLDMSVVVHDDEKTNTKKCTVRVASSIDDGFSLDTATFDCTVDERNHIHVEDKKKLNVDYQSDDFAPIQALYTKWPYFTCSGLKKDFLLLINAFDQEYIQRIEFPNPDRICHTYITETNNLYVLS